MTLPEGWAAVVLNDVLTSSEYGTSAATVGDGTRPVVGMRNMQDGRITLDGVGHLDEELQDWSKLELRAGDLLLNRTNSPDLVGRIGIVQEDTNAVFASYLVRLNTDTSVVDPYFLNYWLNGPQAQRVIKSLVTRGVSQANINPTILRQKCPVLLPPLPEQRKIAEILRTWDEAIASAVTAQSTLRGMKAARSSEFLFGAIQKEETHHRYLLGELFDERNEIGNVGDALLSVTQDSGIVDQRTVGRRNSSRADRSKYKLVLSGDIAYNTMRMWQGASGLSEVRGVVSPAYTVVTPRDHLIDPRYAAHLFKVDGMKFMFERFSQGLTSDTWNLKFPAFAKIEVQLPSLRRQIAVAAYLDEAIREISAYDRLQVSLNAQKRGLMQKLLTGEIRVTRDSAESPGKASDE